MKLIRHNLSIAAFFIGGLVLAYTAVTEDDAAYLLGTAAAWAIAGFILYKAHKGKANG